MHNNELKYMLIGGGALLVALVIAGVAVGWAVDTALIAVPLVTLLMMSRTTHGHAGDGDAPTPRCDYDASTPVPVETRARR